MNSKEMPFLSFREFMRILPNRATPHELSQLGNLPFRQELFRSLFKVEQSAVFEQVAVQSAFSIKAEGLDNFVYLIEGQEALQGETKPVESHEHSVSSLNHFTEADNQMIVERLRGPDGLRIRQSIKQLLHRLDRSQSHERESIMQTFYAEIEPMVVELFGLEGAEGVAHAMDFIEDYLLTKREKLLWSPIDGDDPIIDRILSDKLRAMESISPSQLGMPGTFDAEKIEKLMEGPCEAVRLMEVKRGAGEKAQALLLLNQRSIETISQLGLSTGADCLLPVLLLSMVRTLPERLCSNYRFIARCRRRSAMQGEHSYALTNLQAIIQYLETPLDGDMHPYGHDAPRHELDHETTMMTSIMDKITFVPRAIGSAVVDTFRSRQQRSLSGTSLAVTTIPPSDLQIMRERVSKSSFEELSVSDLRKMHEDYKQLIAGD